METGKRMNENIHSKNLFILSVTKGPMTFFVLAQIFHLLFIVHFTVIWSCITGAAIQGKCNKNKKQYNDNQPEHITSISGIQLLSDYYDSNISGAKGNIKCGKSQYKCLIGQYKGCMEQHKYTCDTPQVPPKKGFQNL